MNIEIPSDFTELKQLKFNEAKKWREETLKIFENVLKENGGKYYATGYQDIKTEKEAYFGRRVFYILSKNNPNE